MSDECNKELLELHNKEQSNPGTVSQKVLLAKYIECTNYEQVFVISGPDDKLLGEAPEDTGL